MQALEWSKQLSGKRHVEARAIVTHETGARLALPSTELDVGLRHGRSELPGIVQQVLDQNPGELRIGVDLELLRQHEPDGSAAIQTSEPCLDRAGDGDEIDPLRLHVATGNAR